MTTCQRLADRRPWIVAALLAATLIAWGSLTPGDEMPRHLPWDKLNHFLGYGMLAGCVAQAGLRGWPAWLGVSAYGVMLEFAQLAVSGREGGDPADMLANALGAALALWLASHLRRLLGLAE